MFPTKFHLTNKVNASQNFTCLTSLPMSNFLNAAFPENSLKFHETRLSSCLQNFKSFYEFHYVMRGLTREKLAN